MSDASERLVKVLESIPGVPETMVNKARNGYYDDIETPIPFPMLQLVRDLNEVRRFPATPHDSRELLAAVIDQVRAGDFDASDADWATYKAEFPL